MPCVSTGNEPRTALADDILPRPLKHDQEAVAKADQVKDMHRQLHHPCQKAGQVQWPTLNHHKGTPHSGQVPVRAIAESRARPSCPPRAAQ
jgi:hypothetical protein